MAVSLGGQYIYVVADLASLRQPDMHQGVLVDFHIDFIESVTKPNQTKSNQTMPQFGGGIQGCDLCVAEGKSGLSGKNRY